MGSRDASVVRDDVDVKVIQITPLQLGTIDVDVTVSFQDGGVAQKNLQVHVVPNAKGVKHFYINHGSHTLGLVLEDKAEDRQSWLEPEVSYDWLEYPIYIKDSTGLRFTVEQPADNPIIRLDADGMIHALRIGQAKIIADFDGVQDSVVVDVYSKNDAPIGYRRVLDANEP